MQEPKLEKLEKLLNTLDKSAITEAEFTQAFTMLTDFIRSTNNATADVLTEVFSRLDVFANELKADSGKDRALVKQAVGQAMGELRIALDTHVASQNAKIDVKLNSIQPPKEVDEQAIIAEVLNRIPPPTVIDIPIDSPDQIIQKINAGKNLILKDRVEGLQDAIRQSIANSVPVTTSFFNGLRAKNLNIVGATARQTGDTVNVTISAGAGTVQSVVAGSGISVDSTDPANPIVSATGGGSFSVLVPTSGVVNGVNKVFVFSTAPQVVVVDNGSTMNKTNITPDLTQNWTGTTTITLQIAPTFNIFAF